MASYKELLQQHVGLNARMESTRQGEFAVAVAELKQLIADFGITAADLGFDSRAPKQRDCQPITAPKYRDPVSGKTWAGRGKPPKWIVGKDRTEFAIE